LCPLPSTFGPIQLVNYDLYMGCLEARAGLDKLTGEYPDCCVRVEVGNIANG